MKKALIALACVVALTAGVAAWLARRPRQTPSGQPPLEALNAGNVSDFAKDFNASPERVRLVLLLSPT